jgi:hypothetical protein
LSDGRSAFIKLDPVTSRAEVNGILEARSTPLAPFVPELYGHLPECHLLVEEGFPGSRTLRDLIVDGDSKVTTLFADYLSLADQNLYLPTLRKERFELDHLVSKMKARLDEVLLPGWGAIEGENSTLSFSDLMAMPWTINGEGYPAPLHVIQAVETVMLLLSAPFSVFGLGDPNPDNVLIPSSSDGRELLFCDFASSGRTTLDWEHARRLNGVTFYPALRAYVGGDKAALEATLSIQRNRVHLSYVVRVPQVSARLTHAVFEQARRWASDWNDHSWQQRTACCAFAALLGSVMYYQGTGVLPAIIVAEALRNVRPVL